MNTYKSSSRYTKKQVGQFVIYGERLSAYDRPTEYAIVLFGHVVRYFEKQKQATEWINNIGPAETLNIMIRYRNLWKGTDRFKSLCKVCLDYCKANFEEIEAQESLLKIAAPVFSFVRTSRNAKNIYEILE